MKIDEFINILRTIDGVVIPDNIIEELSKIKDKPETENKSDNENKSQTKSISNNKKNIAKASLPLPYFPEYNYTGCQALRVNHKLYTPCCAELYTDKFCKNCAKSGAKYGTLDDRKKTSPNKFISPNGDKPIIYGKVMEKLKINKKEVLELTKMFNVTIPEEDFVVIKGKRGRKKKTTVVSSDEEDDNESREHDNEFREDKKGPGRPKQSFDDFTIEDDNGNEKNGVLYKHTNGEVYLKMNNNELYDLQTGEKIDNINIL